MDTGWGDRRRPVVLHVVESFGSGTASAVAAYVASTQDVEHHLLYAIRGAAFKAGREFEDFQSTEEFSRKPLPAIRKLRSAIKRTNPDVIHAHSSFAGLLVRSSVIRTKRHKILYTPHCFGFERLDYSRAVRAGIRIAEAILAINTTAFAACSEHEAELCRRISPTRPVSFVPNVDVSAGNPTRAHTADHVSNDARALEDSRRTVVAMGRLEAQKDPAWFAEACQLDRTDRRWIWIGGGSVPLQSQLERAGVEVTGWLPREDALALMASASVYMHTAAWEGFPMTVLEASSRNVPVVVRGIPCFGGLPSSIVADDPGAAVEIVKALDAPEEATRNSRAWSDYLAINSPEEQRSVLHQLYLGRRPDRLGATARSSKSRGALVVHWGRNGGGPRFTYELARSLHEAGQLCGVSYNTDSELSDAFDQIEAPRLPVQTYRSRLGVVLGLPRLIHTALRFRKFVKDNHPDYVVCAMENVYQSLAVPLSIPRGVPYLFSVHDAVDHPGEEHLLKRGLRYIERARASAYLTYSRSVGETVRTQASKPVMISVLPASNAEPTEADHARGDQRFLAARSIEGREDFIVGFFGRLQPYKGIEQLLAAARILRMKGVPVRICVWGSGPEARWRKEDQSGLIDWHVGWVAEDEVLDILGSFDLLVCPYQEASQSLVIAQAMACGIPAVVTPVGGIQEQVIDTGCGVVCADPTPLSVATAITDLLADTGLYEDLSKNGRRAAADQYSWNRLTTDLIEFGSSVATPEFAR